MPSIQQAREKQLDEFHRQCRRIFIDRNQAYNDAIRVGGLVGAIVTMVGDSARAHNLTFHHGLTFPLERDAYQLRQVLYDISNYAAIAAMMLEDNNIRGGFNAPGPKGVTDEAITN